MTGMGAMAVRGGARRVGLRAAVVVAGLTMGGAAWAEEGPGAIGPPVPVLEAVLEAVSARDLASEPTPEVVAGGATGAEATVADEEAPAASPWSDTESRPLVPAGVAASGDAVTGVASGAAATSLVPEASGVGSTVVSVAGVVALIVVVACVAKMARRGSGGGLNTSRAPSGILEVLGRYPLAGGPTLMLLRVDRRVLLLSQARASRLSGATLSTLAEFEDVDQVASLLAQARDARDESISARFGSLLAGFSAEHGGKASEYETGRVEVVEVEQDHTVNDEEAWPLRAAATAPEEATTRNVGDGAAMLRRRLDGIRQWEGATA